jgi:hypothetical protein
MKNYDYEEQLRFVLRFLEEDLETLAAKRPGTFQDLQTELATFVRGISPGEWAVPLLQALQAEIRDRIIDNVASHNVREMREQEEEHGENYLFPSALRRSPRGERYYFPPPKSDACVYWSYEHGHFYPRFPSSVHRATVDVSTPANRFLWEVCVTLSKIDASRVRICRPKECDRYFFADHGNQWFCSPSCANKARIKRHRYGNPQILHKKEV